jgi:hypothetical protein
MKRNTGCNSHHGCPPSIQCDEAKTIRVDCDNESFQPHGNKLKFPVADIPVALAEVELQVVVESDIYLPTAAKEIKHMRRNVSLTQCKAIRSAMDYKKVKLFISGVVHKNIQYVEQCSGMLKDYSVDVPFTCSQAVKVFNKPDFEHLSQKNAVNERRFIDKKGHGADRCTSGAFTYEYYNEPIECKLLASFVNDLDLFKDFDNWGRFSRITEKMEVGLFLKLLQKQQVDLEHSYGHKEYEESSSSSSSSSSYHESGYDMGYEPKSMKDRMSELHKYNES